MGHLPFASVSKRVPEQNLSYENELCQHESDESLNEMKRPMCVTSFFFLFFDFLHIFYYSTAYNTYRDYNTNNVYITYEANYNNNETILWLDTTEIRLI